MLNGEKVEIEINPNQTLVDMLRLELLVTSVKKGCELGECGACTILLEGLPTTSCLILAPQVEGKQVTTIEGLEKNPLMMDLRESFIKNGAVQCGFCTPGMLLSAYSLLRDNPNPTDEEIKKGIVGNICRCTGYTKIIQAILETAEKNVNE
jgi:carbon-monoxide dehydrogenase small subunit